MASNDTCWNQHNDDTAFYVSLAVHPSMSTTRGCGLFHKLDTALSRSKFVLEQFKSGSTRSPAPFIFTPHRGTSWVSVRCKVLVLLSLLSCYMLQQTRTVSYILILKTWYFGHQNIRILWVTTILWILPISTRRNWRETFTIGAHSQLGAPLKDKGWFDWNTRVGVSVALLTPSQLYFGILVQKVNDLCSLSSPDLLLYCNRLIFILFISYKIYIFCGWPIEGAAHWIFFKFLL